jgi:hypothetical protein
MLRSMSCQPLKAGVTLCFLVLALAVIFTTSPAAGQANTNFGSNSGVPCPEGNVICNGSINFSPRRADISAANRKSARLKKSSLYPMVRSQADTSHYFVDGQHPGFHTLVLRVCPS